VCVDSDDDIDYMILLEIVDCAADLLWRRYWYCDIDYCCIVTLDYWKYCIDIVIVIVLWLMCVCVLLTVCVCVCVWQWRIDC
jgi:hypothetical protein